MPVIGKINPPDHYYFLTNEHFEKGFFKLTRCDSLTLTNQDIQKLPKSGVCIAIPRSIFDKINPSVDFNLKLKLTYNDHTNSNMIINLGEVPLGNVLTTEILKYPDYMTYAIITGGKPSLDLGEKICLLSHGLIFSKFTDAQILDKITRAMHDAIQNVKRSTPTTFTVDNGIGLTLNCALLVSDRLRDELISPQVGVFCLN